MVLSDVVDIVSGLRHIADGMEILSGAGRRMLFSLPFTVDASSLNTVLEETEHMCSIVGKPENADRLSMLGMKLMQVRDIGHTIGRLKEKSVRDDVELFEIKNFAILSESIRELCEASGIDFIPIPGLEEVIRILDPEQKRIPHFYIYDAYSSELASLRAALKKQNNEESGEAEHLRIECLKIEDNIRRMLSDRLKPYAENLDKAFNGVARVDIVLAKAGLVFRLNLTKPRISDSGTVFKGLFNPMLKEVLAGAGKCFQPVDISMGKGPVLITGANMAGKSVLLKTVALAYYMMQFGFYVPAEYAEMHPVSSIRISMGDGQDEMNGLSSFGSEMMKLDEMINRVEKGEEIIALIDEPARTTNPTEGVAIVNAMLDFLEENKVMALVTTHYGGIRSACRKLRVKGFMEDKVKGSLGVDRLNDYIDYSLEENTDGDVAHEAIRISRILGINAGFLERAEFYLKTE